MSKVLLYSAAAAAVSAFSSGLVEPLAEHHAVAMKALTAFQDQLCIPSGYVTFDGPYTEIVFECGETEYEVDVEIYDGVLVAEYIEEAISFSDIPSNVVQAAASAGVDPSKCGMYQIATEVANGHKTWEFEECDSGAADVEVDSVTLEAIKDMNDLSHRDYTLSKRPHVAVAIEALKQYETNACEYTGQYIKADPYTEIILHCGDTEWEADVEMYDGVLVAEYLEKTIQFADMPADVVQAANWVGADLAACGLHQWQIEPATGKVHWEFDNCGLDGSIDIEVDADDLSVMVDKSDKTYRASHYRKEEQVALAALSDFETGCGPRPLEVEHDGPYIKFYFACDKSFYEVYVEIYDGVHVAEWVEKIITFSDVPGNVVAAAQEIADKFDADVSECGDFEFGTEPATGRNYYKFEDCAGGLFALEVDAITLASQLHL